MRLSSLAFFSSISARKLRLIGVVLLGLTGGVYATNYSLWVNGRSSNAQPGNHADFSYWGPASTARA